MAQHIRAYYNASSLFKNLYKEPHVISSSKETVIQGFPWRHLEKSKIKAQNILYPHLLMISKKSGHIPFSDEPPGPYVQSTSNFHWVLKYRTWASNRYSKEEKKYTHRYKCSERVKAMRKEDSHSHAEIKWANIKEACVQPTWEQGSTAQLTWCTRHWKRQSPSHSWAAGPGPSCTPAHAPPTFAPT